MYQAPPVNQVIRLTDSESFEVTFVDCDSYPITPSPEISQYLDQTVIIGSNNAVPLANFNDHFCGIKYLNILVRIIGNPSNIMSDDLTFCGSSQSSGTSTDMLYELSDVDNCRELTIHSQRVNEVLWRISSVATNYDEIALNPD